MNAESFPFDVYDQDKNLILEFLGPQNQSWGPKQKFGQEYIQAKFGKTDKSLNIYVERLICYIYEHFVIIIIIINQKFPRPLIVVIRQHERGFL